MEKLNFYISASRPKDHPFPLVSWLIRLFTWFDSSHVFYRIPYLAFDIPTEKIFHVYFNEVRWESLQYLDTVEIKHTYKITADADRIEDLYQRCWETEGKKQGYYIQLFGILLTLPLRILGIHIRNPLRKFYTSNTCSQHIAESFVEIFDLLEIRTADYPYTENWTEKDVIKFLEAGRFSNPYFKVERI